LTELFDLTIAVEVGLVLAALLFIRRIAGLTHIVSLEPESEPGHPSILAPLPPGVMLYHIQGAFFFGAADKLETALKRAGQEPDILILNVGRVLALDATGVNALGPHTQPVMVMERAGFLDAVGRDNLFGNIPPPWRAPKNSST